MSDSKYLNDEEVLTMLEEMQDQIENLENQNLEAQQMISTISSENSILKKELQKKSEMIVSLNGKIAKLNESDLVLKKNEQLENLNGELRLREKNTRKEAEASILAVKEKAQADIDATREKYEKKESRLMDREYAVSQKEKEVSYREAYVDVEVVKKASDMVNGKIKQLAREYRDKSNKLENSYKKLRTSYERMVFVSLFYGIVITIITACKTEALVDDIVAFFRATGNVTVVLVDWVDTAGTFVAKLGDMIPQEFVAVIVHWLLWLIVFIAILGAFGILIFMLGAKYYLFFKERQADEISVFVALIDLATIVFLAKQIKSILSINLLLLMLFIFVLYSVIRANIQVEILR